MIYSSSYVWAEYKFNDPYKYLKSQSIFLILGYIVMFIVSKFPYQNYKNYLILFSFICLGMLALVLIPGIGTVRNGSRSWFGIGGLGVQPSEFTKLGLIIFTSKYLENNNKDLKDIKKRSSSYIRSTLSSICPYNVRTRLWYRNSNSYDYHSITICKWC